MRSADTAAANLWEMNIILQSVQAAFIASYISYSQVPEYLKNSEVKAWDCYEVDDDKVIFVVVKEIRG